ncbi:MAG TPA: DUF6491 family protein [Rhodanobacteraceae bacterium]|jgi:hypothetical protein|nr:DUF6491 family protein [Rhodanobacteraceae bacterium]
MNTASRFAIAALASAISVVALAKSPKQRDAENLALFQRYASPPQDAVHYFRTDGFEYLGKNAQGEDALALWTGVNQVYLLTLQSPCVNLDLANAVALTSTSGSVHARMDFVKYGRDRQCRIETIRKVDYKAVRAAKVNGQPSGT